MKRHEDFFFFPPMGEPSQYEMEKKETVRLVDSCEPKKPYVERKLSERDRSGGEGGEWHKQYRISLSLRLI